MEPQKRPLPAMQCFTQVLYKGKAAKQPGPPPELGAFWWDGKPSTDSSCLSGRSEVLRRLGHQVSIEPKDLDPSRITEGDGALCKHGLPRARKRVKKAPLKLICSWALGST